MRYLFEGWIPCGEVTLMIGRPAAGKSTLATEFAARVLASKPMPGESVCLYDGPRSVLHVVTEESTGAQVKPRYRGAGVDETGMERLIVYDPTGLKGEARVRAQEGLWLGAPLAQTIESVRLGLLSQGKPPLGLVIADNATALAPPGTDTNSATAAGGMLLPLVAVAEEHQIPIIVLAHTRKGGGRGQDRALGSTAFMSSVRASCEVWQPEDTPGAVHLWSHKNSGGPRPKPLAFEFEERTPPGRSRPVGGLRYVGLSDREPGDDDRGASRGATRIDDGAQLLHDALTDRPGEDVPREQLVDWLLGAGIEGSTADKAIAALGRMPGITGHGKPRVYRFEGGA